MKTIVEHSILSNVTVSSRKTAGEGQPHPCLLLTLRGDPFFQPKTQVEGIAKSVEGQITIDLSGPAFTLINAAAGYTVQDNNHYLVKENVPLLVSVTRPFNGANLPVHWEMASFRMAQNASEWEDSLRRTFATRKSCSEFHGEGTILPGFEPMLLPAGEN